MVGRWPAVESLPVDEMGSADKQFILTRIDSIRTTRDKQGLTAGGARASGVYEGERQNPARNIASQPF